MDLNEKVEQLAKITAELKNEVNELKGKDLNTRINELEAEKEALKNDIVELKDSLMQQNQTILSLLRKQNAKLVETLESDKPHFKRKVSKYAKLFPIKSLKELDELDKLINDKNLNEMVAIVHQLLAPHGIVKNIVAVISTECILQCNVDGHHNKRRLQNSHRFMDLLFKAAHHDGYSQKQMLEDIRRAFKMVKNRYNKNLCRHRQLERQRQEQQTIDEPEQIEEIDIIEPDDLIKIEDMFFE